MEHERERHGFRSCQATPPKTKTKTTTTAQHELQKDKQNGKENTESAPDNHTTKLNNKAKPESISLSIHFLRVFYFGAPPKSTTTDA